MDQIKIGGFIAARRRAKGWTQSQLAERLGLTDKAVSKWETGRSMPDLSLFAPLCGLLDISLNELLAGESIPQERLREKADEVLLEVITGWLGRDLRGPEEPAAEPHCVLNLRHVRKVYETGAASALAVDDVSFQVSQGCFVGIMGASGCGKTTLLNLIATIDRPTGGTIEINGQSLSDVSETDLAKFRRDHLGFIFQEYNLIDTLTLYENIALALTVKEVPKETIRPIVLEWAQRLEISHVLDRFPREVSGGQRQRCACARAVAVSPSLILADEPTGALDSHSARHLLETLVTLCREYGATILMVTHDALSASYCDRILLMRDGAIKTVLERAQQPKQAFFGDILEAIARLTEESLDVY